MLRGRGCIVRAYVLDQYGGPEVLTIREIPSPPLAADSVRVRVAATAINRADLLQRRGLYPGPPMPYEIPGLEFSGEVTEVGDAVSAFKPGDRVMGLLAGGGYAEEVVTPADLVLPVPDALSLEEAAALPEAFFTAWDALTQLDVRAGDWLLVHAAASGVGTTLVQLGRALGARVIGTAGGPDKCGRVAALGAEVVVDRHRGQGFLATVRDATRGQGVDAIADLVGGGYFQENLEALAPLGRLLVIGTITGREASINLGLVLSRRLRIMGTQLRNRTRGEKALLTRAVGHHVLPLVERGLVRPVVDRVFAFAEMADAHRWMEANRNIGKIVVRVAGSG
jgi:putative PIG3 family NAD(P)H quinone oxidoreductase